MKALIIIIGVSLGIIIGLFPKIEKPKPFLWKLTAIIFVSVLIIMNFLPPIGASFSMAKYLSGTNPEYSGNVLAYYVPSTEKYDPVKNLWTLRIRNGEAEENLIYNGKNLPDELKMTSYPRRMILKLKFDSKENAFLYRKTISVNPLLVLPLVPGLEEQVRILNFHVPVAWISVLAYMFAMIYSIGFLKTRDIQYDLKATASAEIGTVFCLLATVTGMVWAKLNWGSFWNWDPRETSIFILLLIYGAYFALRSAIDNEEVRARLSSVYSIIAFITVPFLIFVLPRIVEGLHPGSNNDTTTGPILSKKDNTLNYLQQITFSIGFASFSIIYFWLLSLRYRLKKIDYDEAIS